MKWLSGITKQIEYVRWYANFPFKKALLGYKKNNFYFCIFNRQQNV